MGADPSLHRTQPEVGMTNMRLRLKRGCSERTLHMFRRLSITIVVAGLAAGCSVSDYKEPIGIYRLPLSLQSTPSTPSMPKRLRFGIRGGEPASRREKYC